MNCVYCDVELISNQASLQCNKCWGRFYFEPLAVRAQSKQFPIFAIDYHIHGFILSIENDQNGPAFIISNGIKYLLYLDYVPYNFGPHCILDWIKKVHDLKAFL